MSTSREVTAKSPKLDRVSSVFVDFGETVEESIEMFGGDAVNSNAFANGVVTIQAGIRGGHKAGLTDEQIQEKYKNWKLGVAVAKTGGAITVEAMLAKTKTMTEDELAAYIELLREQAAQM